MPEAVIIAIVSAILNGAVTWGVVSTKLAWIRRDVDAISDRVQWLERREARA